MGIFAIVWFILKWLIAFWIVAGIFWLIGYCLEHLEGFFMVMIVVGVLIYLAIVFTK
jgi:hypothetical protein